MLLFVNIATREMFKLFFFMPYIWGNLQIIFQAFELDKVLTIFDLSQKDYTHRKITTKPFFVLCVHTYSIYFAYFPEVCNTF